MWSAFRNLMRVETIRRKIFITLGLLFIYRLGRQIPIPGVNMIAWKEYVAAKADSGLAQLIGLMNSLSGANVNVPVLFSLGILPYITSSIIFSLLVKVLPSLESLSKEGAAGQKKINQYSRMMTVPLCMFQGTAICLTFFKGVGTEQAGPVIPEFGLGFVIMAVLAMTAGTIFLMWLGEQITEFGIGNGISLMIMAGIVGDVPTAFYRIWQKASGDPSYLMTGATLIALYMGIVLAVVYMTKGQRRIPIQQAKLVKGNKMYGGARHYLPVKLNMANVMPVIFASALLMLPTTVIGWASGGRDDAFLSYGGWWWITIEVILIFFFSYFWTSLMFQPSEMANNLKEYGSFIPGIRPGKKTADFLEKVMVRITLVGAAFLAVIAVIPTLVAKSMNVDWIVASFLGGTGILIVVGVALDLVDQLNSSLLQRDYEGFMSAASARRGRRG